MIKNYGDIAEAAIAVGSGNPTSASDSGADARSAWEISKPEHRHYSIFVTELNSSRLVGEEGIFDRGPHVPIRHMRYFEPPHEAFSNELCSQDRRSAKE